MGAGTAAGAADATEVESHIAVSATRTAAVPPPRVLGAALSAAILDGWSYVRIGVFLIPNVYWALVLFVISLVVNTGMWLERFIIVVTSLHRDFLPSTWGMYWPTRWDIFTYIGTLGLFFTLFFLFVRYLPLIAISEMRGLVKEERNEKQ